MQLGLSTKNVYILLQPQGPGVRRERNRLLPLWAPRLWAKEELGALRERSLFH